MKIAVIPARGGSKRIPRKNIKDFRGTPMLLRAIQTARRTGLFGRIIVSTDDKEIAEVAVRGGAEVPFLRPPALADDLTPTVPVIAHSVRACADLGWSVDYACCIYPCVPLLNEQDISDALTMAITHDADFVYPVTEYAHPIQRAMRRLPDGKMQFLSPEHEMTRTQDLERTFHDAGQFYWGKATAWLAGKRMHTAGMGLPIPNWRVVDIDSEDDWHRAELIHKALWS